MEEARLDEVAASWGSSVDECDCLDGAIAGRVCGVKVSGEGERLLL